MFKPTLLFIAGISLMQPSPCAAQSVMTGFPPGGSALPSVCSVGQLFFLTSAPAGQNIFGCTVPNVWTPEGGSLPAPSKPTSTVSGSVSFSSDNALTVPAGGALSIAADRPSTWTLTPGSLGSISTTATGIIYQAPASVSAQNVVAGCMVLPNDSVFNTPVDKLPVHASSAAWVKQALGVGAVGISFGESWSPNIADNSTPSTSLTFHYTTQKNGIKYPLLSGNNRLRETGSITTDGNNDHHMITVNRQTCHFYETYQDTLTDGPAASASAASGWDYLSTSYASPSYSDGGGTTDAAGLPLLPLTAHLSEIESGSINHALRFTSCAGCISNPALWPAIGSTAATPGAAPMGSRWRLKSTYDVSKFSAKAQVILKALQKYGMILADIGGINQIQMDFDVNEDPAVHSALTEIQTANITAGQFEIVDESALMVSKNSNEADPLNGVQAVPGYAVLVAKDSAGNQLRVPIAVQPVTVGTPYPVVSIQAGTVYKMQSWVNGSSNQNVAWTLTDGPGSISGNFYQPSAVERPTPFVLTGTTAADANATVSIRGYVIPSGAIRIDVGNPNPYTDSQGNLWMADTMGVLTGSYADDNRTYPSSMWGKLTDWMLYGWDKYTWGDDIVYGPFVVPNGSYTVSFLFAKADCSGTFNPSSGFDNGLVSGGPVGIEANGQLVSFDLSKSVKKACLTPAIGTVPVTVTDHLLTLAVRATGGEGTHQAPFLSALQIVSK